VQTYWDLRKKIDEDEESSEDETFLARKESQAATLEGET